MREKELPLSGVSGYSEEKCAEEAARVVCLYYSVILRIMLQKRRYIAFLGMPGSGKTEATTYVQRKYSCPKVYFGQITLDEMKKRGLEPTQDNERVVREDLRDRFGEDYYAQEIVRRIESLEDVPTVLIESLYSWVEYEVLKKRFGDRFFAITIHASPATRYARLAQRKERPLDREKAEARDIAQLKRLEQGMPIALSDRVIENNGTVEELHKRIEEVLESLR